MCGDRGSRAVVPPRVVVTKSVGGRGGAGSEIVKANGGGDASVVHGALLELLALKSSSGSTKVMLL